MHGAVPVGEEIVGRLKLACPSRLADLFQMRDIDLLAIPPPPPRPSSYIGFDVFFGDADDERPDEKLPLRVTSIVGSPHYMAPEVSTGSAAVSHHIIQLSHHSFPCLGSPPCCAVMFFSCVISIFPCPSRWVLEVLPLAGLFVFLFHRSDFLVAEFPRF